MMAVKEIDPDGHVVWTTTMGLRIKVDNNLFNKGKIHVKCVSSILGRDWEISKNITHHNKIYQPPLYSTGKY